MSGHWVAVVVCAVGLCEATNGIAQVEPRIAQTSGDEIRVMLPDGTGRITVTRTPAGYSSFGPAWSADGVSLGFVRRTDYDDSRERPEKSELMVVDTKTGRSRMVASDAWYGAPTFSPDGRWMAYGAEVTAGGDEITSALRIVGSDGSGGHALTQPQGTVHDADPAWSPDGSTVAFTRLTYSERKRAIEIWSVAPDGSGARRLADMAQQPAWSPDGRQIAFVSFRDGNGQTCFHDCSPNGELYLMDADGGNPRRLTHTTTAEGSPDWSPDGAQIAFSSSRPIPTRNSELYSTRSDGSCVTRLTNTSAPNSEPAWRPATPAYAAPLVCDGAVSGALQPLMETELGPSLRYRRFPIAWLGRSYRDVLLSGVDVGASATMIYDDCGLVSGRCPVGELQVQTASICARHPLLYGGYRGLGESDGGPHVRRYRRVRGALLADPPSGMEIYSGRITVTLFGASGFRQAIAVGRRLRLLRSNRSALRPPAFGGKTLARVRAVRRLLRRHGMRELSRRWHASPEQITAALKLRGALRRSELRRGTRCPRHTSTRR